jgi:hypothetical protein
MSDSLQVLEEFVRSEDLEALIDFRSCIVLPSKAVETLEVDDGREVDDQGRRIHQLQLRVWMSEPREQRSHITPILRRGAWSISKVAHILPYRQAAVVGDIRRQVCWPTGDV